VNRNERSGSFVLVGLMTFTLSAATARANCTTSEDQAALCKSIRQAMACNDRRLRDPSASCELTPAPACADALVSDVLALAYGANNPALLPAEWPAQKPQLACQRRIGRAVDAYIRTYLGALRKSMSPRAADERARRELDRLPSHCSVAVDTGATGLTLPSVGPQCGAATVDRGSVDAAALGECLRTLLQTWVDRQGPDPQPLRPNIVVIQTDDQRFDTTDAMHGFNGNPVMSRVRAEIAEAGVEFRNAFITTPLCCPSRASLLSGQYAFRHGVYGNFGINAGADDFDDRNTLAGWLQAAGYRTGLIGRYLNGYWDLWTDPDPPYVPPFWDEWHAFRRARFYDYLLVRHGAGYDHVVESHGSTEKDYSTDVLREIAIDFIVSSVRLGQPFFLYFTPLAPHLPRQPAPRHVGMFAGIAPWRPPSYDEADVSDKPTWVQNTAALDATSQADIDQLRVSQLEMLQAVDEAIGGNAVYGITGIIPTLRDLGVLDDTIIVYLSDNGYQWGEHRLQEKNHPYEESIRIPFIVRYPKLAPLPRTESRVVLNIDIAQTLLELAGAAATIPQDGRSLVRVLDDTATSWRSDFLAEAWPSGHVWASVRGSRWKYTELPLAPGNPLTGFEKELYDLTTDRFELNNLSADPSHTGLMNDLALRLRQIRPNWPLDSASSIEDPEE
jgi:arylsulfatase A-like enzyme